MKNVIPADVRFRNMKNVIPAQAGIHIYLDKSLLNNWIPACAGMTFSKAGTSLVSCLRRNEFVKQAQVCFPAYAGMNL